MVYHVINVRFLVERTGLDEAVVRLLTGLLIAYPLSFLYGIVLYKKHPMIQHVFLTVFGLFLAVFLYGVEGLHTLVAVTVQYLFIHIIGPNSLMIVLSFIFQMTYLIVGYLKYSTDLYDIAWTTAQCIVVLRLIGVAWDTYDGAQDLEKASSDTKALALKRPPTYLEMTGHVYFFGSFVVGPQFPMRRYLSFIHGTLIPIEHDNQSIKIKKGLLRFAAGVVYLTVYVLFEVKVNNELLVSKEFEAFSLIKKLAYITLWGRVVLCKYLGVWLIAEGSCIMSGLTYNGKSESGEPRWDALKNCKLTIYETATTLQGVIDSFNVNTNMWMSRYLFKRLRFLGNKTLSHLSTLLFLAVWHGIYIGYIICFISEYAYITAERQVLSVSKLVTEKLELENHSILKPFKTSFSFCFKTILMSYCLLPFCLLTLPKILKVYSTTYALPHVLLVTWFIVYSLIAPSLFKKDAGKKEDSKKAN